MARAPSFAGVILAAGESSRMGRDKALLPWHGSTFLRAHIDSLQMHTDLVIVVAGKNATALRPLVDAAAAFLVVNPHPELGQFSSLQTGLQAVLDHGRDAAIVALVDRPPATPDTVEQLRMEFQRSASDKWAVVPEYAGRHGHPIVVGREMITALLVAPVTSSARDVEHENPEHIAYVTVDDRFTVTNVDTPEDYEKIQE
jgi:molybdenum cofactor cytidylyltransferase